MPVDLDRDPPISKSSFTGIVIAKKEKAFAF